MLHRVLTLLVVLGMTIGAASSAVAGVLAAPDSKFTLRLGGLAPITIDGTYTLGGNATVSNNGGGHDVADSTGIWSTAGNAAGTSLFTGVNLITDLVLTAGNGAGSFTPAFSAANSVAGNLTNVNQTVYSGTICPTGCLGGTETVTGQTVVKVAGTGFAFQNDIIGVGGTGTLMVGTATIAATGGPFVTGKVRITNVTSNVVQLPNRSPVVTGPAILMGATSMEEVKTFTTMGGFLTSNPSGQLETVATITLSGTNQLASASSAGQVTLVSPLRIDTGPLSVGNIPGVITKTFVFVPEPGTLLLLASGAAGLVMIGRRRSRK
jgi:hypothetical protein